MARMPTVSRQLRTYSLIRPAEGFDQGVGQTSPFSEPETYVCRERGGIGLPKLAVPQPVYLKSRRVYER